MTPADPINSNFEAIGFESMYILINLGTILVLLLMFPVLIIFDVLLRLTKWNCSLKASKRIRKALFWNSTIRFYKESYAIILMCCFINLQYFTWNTVLEGVSSSLTVLLIVVGLLFPIIIVCTIHANYD